MKKEPITFVTFLGPVGATFSHEAYDVLANIYHAPSTLNSKEGIQYCHPARTNLEIPGKVARHGGYGAIAMETLTEARVSESLEGFIRLLKTYDRLEVPVTDSTKHIQGCPMHVMGAVNLEIHFCLMVRKDADLKALSKVFAHEKAAGACRKHLATDQLQVIDVATNGEGARRVAEDAQYASYAALGPRSAAEKYGLQILEENYEDQKAVTTFFLLGPRLRKVSIGKENRALIVFRLPHEPGSLVQALQPFDSLNLIQIHTMHVGNHAYDFAIEVDVPESELAAFHKARMEFEKRVLKHLIFGPFEVLSR